MKQTVLKSDLSGAIIEGKAALMSIQIEGEKVVHKLDLTEEEAREFASKGRTENRRGRPSKAAVAA